MNTNIPRKRICTLAFLFILWTAQGDGSQANPATIKDQTDLTQTRRALILKHDLNKNGKIDVSERKAYTAELSREAQALAAEQRTRKLIKDKAPETPPDRVSSPSGRHLPKLQGPEGNGRTPRP